MKQLSLTWLLRFLAVLLLSVSFYSCWLIEDDKTELEKLPPETQEGKNTLGFLLNGEAWIPKGSFFKSKLDVSFDEESFGFEIETIKNFAGQNKSQSLYFSIDSLGVVGDYQILSDDFVIFDDSTRLCRGSSIVGNGNYDALPGGIITITKLDTVLDIISGTFEFDVVNNTCMDTLKITNGRFDAKY
jgi:hypothetical protein